jgi:hypothetical protein
MEPRQVPFRSAIEVAGFRRIYLLNGSIILSLRKPSADEPVLLIVEGQYSQTTNLGVVDKARKHSVANVTLPPHSTHIMQPLDVGTTEPLKTYYAQEIETWLGSNAGRVFTPFVAWKLFGPAYRRAATMEASVNHL